MQITFNTERMYTARGQIVTAKYDAETGKVWFNDHSRMVSGSFTVVDGPEPVSLLWERNHESFARAVMRKYDAGGTYECPIEDYRISRELREGATILQYRI